MKMTTPIRKKDVRNLFKLKKEKDDNTINDVRNIFRQKTKTKESKAK